MKLKIVAGVIGGLVALVIGLSGGTFLMTSLSGIFTGLLVGVINDLVTKKEEK